MSIWEEHRIEERVTAILSDVNAYQPDHHFGRPYLTAYQLAIALDRIAPQARQALGSPVGGEGIGQHDSLAQYLARELSRRIHTGSITHIEGAFISNQHLRTIEFDAGDRVIRSSLTDSQYDLSMYRLRN
jgi:hypothetical protein